MAKVIRPPPTVPPRAAAARAQRRPLLRMKRFWLCIIGGAGIMAVLIAWMCARSTPSWYRPLSAQDTAVQDEAEQAKRKVFTELHNAMERTPLGDQRWTITQDEINAALAVAFMQAMETPAAGGGAPVISSPFVLLKPGVVTIAARTTRVSSGDPNGGVMAASFIVESSVGGGGAPMGNIRLSSAQVGRLPIPTSLLHSRIQAMEPALVTLANQAITMQFNNAGQGGTPPRIPEIEAAVHAIINAQPFPLSFTVDRRKVLVKEIRVEDGSLTIVFSPPTPAVVPPHPVR